jgi:hypothetical protein
MEVVKLGHSSTHKKGLTLEVVMYLTMINDLRAVSSTSVM